MNFITYNEFKEIKAQQKEALNEAWKSKKIMGLIDIADKNSNRAWYQSFVKDFYKKFNISIDKIKDSDFTEIKPTDFFNKQPYNIDKDKYLAIFINDDPKLKQDAKAEVSKKVTELATAKEKHASKQEQESIKAEIDLLKKLDVPVIVAIGMGVRAVFYGFQDEKEIRFNTPPDKLPPATKKAGIQYSTPRHVLRYGINAATWLQMRYWGLSKGTKLSQENTADRSTKLFVVNVEDLKAKYDMGSKLSDREEAKVNNPFFATDAEIKTGNLNKYRILKDKNLTPEKVQKEITKIVKSYSKYYTDLIADPTASSVMALNNQAFKLEGKEYKGIASVFNLFTEIINEYSQIFKNYTKLLKGAPAKLKKLAKAKHSSTQQYSAEEMAFKKELEGYKLDMIALKEKAERIVVTLKKAGVEFKIK